MPLFSRDKIAGLRAGPTLLFVGSAALAAGLLRFAWEAPLAAAALLAGSLAYFASRWFGQRKLRKLLRSGDVRSVLARWSPSLERVPHPETMGPLMKATALAAFGRVEQAREAMAEAERGPAWDAALEHRLFLDTMLLTFEGDCEAARDRSHRLVRLPLPPTSSALRDRVVTLREAVGALARAFAHEGRPGDALLLEQASESSPLVFWAMRYAAAVSAIDDGDAEKARSLLRAAPDWPAESVFRSFHDEIAARTEAA